MKWRRLCLLVFWMLGSLSAAGQVADFSIPATACINQFVSPQNSSSGATRYIWDFCQDGLGHLSSAGDVTTITGSNIPVGMKVAYDQGNWYGFACSRDGGTKLSRLDFGSSLTNTPTLTDLTSAISAYTGSSEISLIKVGANWYGFVVDWYTKSNIIRLDFGNSLANAPATNNLGNISASAWDGLYGISVVQQGANFFGFVTSSLTNSIGVLSFGNSITNIPAASTITSALLNDPIKVEILKQGNGWYGFVTSLGNNSIVLLNFGANLSSAPAVSSIASIANGAGIQVVKDGDNVYGFVFGTTGNLKRLDFGTSATNAPTITDLGAAGSTNVVYGFSLTRDWPNWKAVFIEVFSKKVHLLAFNDQCADVTLLSSTTVSPVVHYNTSGSKTIQLAAFSASGAVDTLSRRLTVQALNAPNVNIVAQNQCVNAAVLFGENLVSGSPITSSSWQFGDGHTDNQASTQNIYVAAGTYSVQLDVQSANGCANRTIQPITIYHQPTADFLLPANNPLCTNQQLNFTNTSTTDAGSTVSWQWYVNDTAVANTQNLQYSFTHTTLTDIKLRTSIPGCFSESAKSIASFLSGPNVNFSAPTGCVGTPLDFTNLTVDPTTGFLWDFGDGQTSLARDIAHTYATNKPYTVSLTGGSVNGCQNQVTRTITVYSTPQPSFTIALPPFSCSGSPSQFNNTTPNPVDSNISTWSWSFGDVAGGTSSQKNPFYNYSLAGDYAVNLTAKTNFGCTASIQLPVTVTQSPVASFTFPAACANQGTKFTDTSTGSIKSWSWLIGANSYLVKDPLNVFPSQGSYTAQLVVTDYNGCNGVIAQQVDVPIFQLPDFSSGSTCAAKAAVFEDITPVSSDPFISYTWDFGGQGTGTGAKSQFTFSTPGSYAVTMDAHAQSGCMYPVTKTISIVSPPVAGFTASPESGAAPLGVQFTNASTHAATYWWKFHNQANDSSSVASPFFTFTDLGDYVVDLNAFSLEGCIDTYSRVIHAVVPRVDAGLISLQLIPDQASGQLQVLFVINNAGNLPLINPTVRVEISGTTTLNENLNITLVQGETLSQVLRYTLDPANIRYVCMEILADSDTNLTNNQACATINQEVMVVGLYPNPVHGELHLDWIGAGEGPAHVTIFNTAGEKTFDKEVETVDSGLHQIRIDVSSLTSGVYLAHLSYSGFNKTLRFVVN